MNKIDKKLEDIFQLEELISKNTHISIYKTDYKSSSILLVKYNSPLSEVQIENFINRFKKIDNIEPVITSMNAFGVDSENYAFAIFNIEKFKSILSSDHSKTEITILFKEVLKIVKTLHENNILIDNIDQLSFVVNEEGKVELINIFGILDDSQLEETPFKDNSYNPKIGPSYSTDIYALGVLAYYLFNKKYPFSDENQNIEEQFGLIANQDNKLNFPSWYSKIIYNSLHPNDSKRFFSATDMFDALVELKDTSETINKPSFALSKNADLNHTPSFSRLSELSEKQKVNTEKHKLEIENQNIQNNSIDYKKLFLFIFLLLGLLVLVGYFLIGKKDNNQNQKLETDLSLQADDSIESKLSLIDELKNEADSDSYEQLVKLASESTKDQLKNKAEVSVFELAKKYGLERSTEITKKFILDFREAGKGDDNKIVKSKNNITPAKFENILLLLSKDLDQDKRVELLNKVYELYPKLCLDLLAAQYLDLNTPSYLKETIKDLYSKAFNIEKYSGNSAEILFYLNLGVMNKYGSQIEAIQQDVSPEDIKWLLRVATSSSFKVVKDISRLAISKKVFTPLNQSYLEVIVNNNNLSSDVSKSLIKATFNEIEEDDLHTLGIWYDAQSIDVLLKLVSSLEDENLERVTFDILSGKNITKEPVASILNWVKKNHVKKRGEFAKTLGIFAFPNIFSTDPEKIDYLLKTYGEYLTDKNLLKLFISSNNSDLLAKIIKTYPEKISLFYKLNLLKSDSKDLKITVIDSIETNDVGALNIIVSNYEKEKDLEVKQAYRDKFWVLKDRK